MRASVTMRAELAKFISVTGAMFYSIKYCFKSMISPNFRKILPTPPRVDFSFRVRRSFDNENLGFLSLTISEARLFMSKSLSLVIDIGTR